MDAQSDCREISLADLSTQLIEANPSAEHQVVGDPLVVGHVIHKSLKWRLLHSLRFAYLWDGTHSSSRGRRLGCLFLPGSLIFGSFTRSLLWPEVTFECFKKN